jgi:hypothetical protein
VLPLREEAKNIPQSNGMEFQKEKLMQTVFVSGRDLEKIAEGISQEI